MKITKSQLKRIIQEETKNLRKEGFMDWFKGKKEEPTTEPEAQENPEAAAEALWQALEDEFREVYRGVTDGVPHLDDCRSMECEKLIKKFWLMWEEVKPSPETTRSNRSRIQANPNPNLNHAMIPITAAAICAD